MSATYIDPFIVSAVNVIKTMCNTQPIPGAPTSMSGSKTKGAVTGVIGLAGPECTGNLILSFDESCALYLVSKMLMEQQESLSKDVLDAIGELTNIITGSSKVKLSELGLEIDMATPMVFTGQGISIKQNSSTSMTSIQFETPAGQFSLQTNLTKR